MYNADRTGEHTKARGPDAARQSLLSGPAKRCQNYQQNQGLNYVKIEHIPWKTECWKESKNIAKKKKKKNPKINKKKKKPQKCKKKKKKKKSYLKIVIFSLKMLKLILLKFREVYLFETDMAGNNIQCLTWNGSITILQKKLTILKY